MEFFIHPLCMFERIELQVGICRIRLGIVRFIILLACKSIRRDHVTEELKIHTSVILFYMRQLGDLTEL